MEHLTPRVVNTSGFTSRRWPQDAGGFSYDLAWRIFLPGSTLAVLEKNKIFSSSEDFDPLREQVAGGTSPRVTVDHTAQRGRT
uniref:Uncharacterized protein n=1 Tax=Nelumbo nucifera TaxID=4432 RepID=A0A822XXF7_NELNU|nr:TPA_asm: hypothetical protein HUJ06_026166 [Nelumbo nucifera]